MRLFAFLPVLFLAGSLPGQTAKAGEPPFTVTIAAEQAAAKIGSPIIIHIVLRANSEKTLTIPEARHDGTHGEYNYRVSVVGPKRISPPDTKHGRNMKKGTEVRTLTSTIIKYLNKGDELTEDVDLQNVVSITEPGDYVVQVERADPAFASMHIKSNKLALHVGP